MLIMGRYTKYSKLRRSDLWAEAGGTDALVNELQKADVLNTCTEYSSTIWSQLSTAVFGKDEKKNRHWLWAAWTKNRNGVRDRVHLAAKENNLGVAENEPREKGLDVSEVEVLKQCLNSKSDTEGFEPQSEAELLNYTSQEPENLSTRFKQKPPNNTSSEEHNDKQSEEENNMASSPQDSALRPIPRMRRKFSIFLKGKKWTQIRPLQGSSKLRYPWTDYFYKSFQAKNRSCTLCFKYQHRKPLHSRKRNAPFFHALATCTFPSCQAKYTFIIKQIPSAGDKKIEILVTQSGKIQHKVTEKKCRPSTHYKRGKIAKALIQGPSHYFYRKLGSTPKAELLAGNMSKCLNKNILKVIGADARKKQCLHNDILMEMHLTQTILKETDTKFLHMPGYIQHFSLDPFGVHMYTETAINILLQHLRKKVPFALYLDATGGVVSKLPCQPKRVLYYSLTLPGGGRDAPPIPICEMLSNDHSVPAISFWLMQFTLQLSKYTRLNIQQIETDYSWALMQSVLLAFNKENITSYLDRAFEICRGKMAWDEIREFTILHLCSAHVLKSVKQAVARQTSDIALRDFVTFAFARLQNATSISEAGNIFKEMCTVLSTLQNTEIVQASVKVLECLILKTQVGALDDPVLEDWEMEHCSEEKIDVKSIVRRSPFTDFFQQLFAKVKEQGSQKAVSNEENLYYCPEILTYLFDTYLAIYPLWSGVLLGNLRRYASDPKTKNNVTIGKEEKTRDTNCHVEKWFGIVKHSIIQQKCIRPGAFVRKMFTSLQARYTEHILHHNLCPEVLLRPSAKKDISQFQEKWAKKKEKRAKATKSKFFSAPQHVPAPQKNRKMQVNKVSEENNKESGSLEDCKISPDVASVKDEVELLWGNMPTDILVAILRSPDTTVEHILHHRDFQSLRPHNWLVGEAIESYFRAILNSYDPNGNIYQMSHFTSRVILNNEREKMARQSLRKVNLQDFSGLITFVNVNDQHWRFVYLHAMSNTVFVIDSQRGSDEMLEAEQACYAFSEYFKMRRNQHGKEDWLDIKWTPGTINHTFQKDSVSCGVFVMQVAKLIVKEFPQIPQTLNINPTKKWMGQCRKEMAEEILLASVSREEYCSLCGNEECSQKDKFCIWVQCDKCKRWYHVACTKAAVQEDQPWFCGVCI